MPVLASCSATVQLHDTTSYEQVCKYDIYKKCDYSSISWSSDGKALAASSQTGRIQVLHYSNKQLQLLQKVDVPESTIACFMKTSPRSMGVGTACGTVVIWDCKTSQKKKFEGFGGVITSIDFNNIDSYGAVSLKDGDVVLFNYSNFRLQNFTMPTPKSSNRVCFHTVKKGVLGAVSDVGDVVVWDIFSSRQLFTKLKAHRSPCSDMSFSSENYAVCVSVGYDKALNCYDVFRTKDQNIMNTVTQFPCQSVDFASDGHTVAVGSTRGPIFIYDLRKINHPAETITSHDSRVNRVVFQTLKQKESIPWAECFQNGQQDSEDSTHSGSQDSLSFDCLFPLGASITDSSQSVSPGTSNISIPVSPELDNNAQNAKSVACAISPEKSNPVRPACRSPGKKESPLRVQVLNKVLAESLNSEFRVLQENVRHVVTEVQTDFARTVSVEREPLDKFPSNSSPPKLEENFVNDIVDKLNNLSSPLVDNTTPKFIVPSVPKEKKCSADDVPKNMFLPVITSTPMIAISTAATVASGYPPENLLKGLDSPASSPNSQTVFTLHAPVLVSDIASDCSAVSVDSEKCNSPNVSANLPVCADTLHGEGDKGTVENAHGAEGDFKSTARCAERDVKSTTTSVAVQVNMEMGHEDTTAILKDVLEQNNEAIHYMITKQSIIAQDYIVNAMNQRFSALEARLNQVAHLVEQRRGHNKRAGYRWPN